MSLTLQKILEKKEKKSKEAFVAWLTREPTLEVNLCGSYLFAFGLHCCFLQQIFQKAESHLYCMIATWPFPLIKKNKNLMYQVVISSLSNKFPSGKQISHLLYTSAFQRMFDFSKGFEEPEKNAEDLGRVDLLLINQLGIQQPQGKFRGHSLQEQ